MVSAWQKCQYHTDAHWAHSLNILWWIQHMDGHTSVPSCIGGVGGGEGQEKGTVCWRGGGRVAKKKGEWKREERSLVHIYHHARVQGESLR